MSDETTTPDEGTDGTDAGSTDVTANLNAALRQERSERKKLEKQLAELAAADEQRKAIEIQSIEELRAKLSEATSALETAKQEAATERKVGKLRSLLGEAHNADDALAFLPLSELDDDSDFTAAVDALKTAKPYLFKAEDGGPANKGTAPQGNAKKQGSEDPASVLARIFSQRAF